MKEIIFLVVAIVTVVSAIYVTFSKNIVYSAFALLLTLASMAGLYLFLSADFLAGIQLLLYVGGILVLIIFAVMMTQDINKKGASNLSRFSIAAVVIILSFLAYWLHGIWNMDWAVKAQVYQSTTSRIGDSLLRKYLLPFEVISVLLLVGLVGAIAVARLSHVVKAKDEEK
jgi:NADH-quinone oxidoreductase subunit J